MTKFLFLFYGGKKITTQQERDEVMAAWGKWFTEMGGAVADMGAPTMPGKLVNAKGVKEPGKNAATGYSVIQADNLEAAIALAKKCPIIGFGGEVLVSSFMPM